MSNLRDRGFFSGNIDTIASANGEQLAKLAFALVREDRFSEGRLAKAYDDKILLAIVERAEELLKGLAGPRNKLRAR